MNLLPFLNNVTISDYHSTYLCQFQRLSDKVDDLLPVPLGVLVEVLLVVHEQRDEPVHLECDQVLRIENVT